MLRDVHKSIILLPGIGALFCYIGSGSLGILGVDKALSIKCSQCYALIMRRQ